METQLRTVAYAAGMEMIFAWELLTAAMGIWVPLSQTLFSVAEVSKQGICPDKCRKAARSTHRCTPFLL